MSTVNEKTDVSSGQELVITRSFNAPRDLVWKAWTDSKMISQWFGPKGFTIPLCEWTPEAGKTLRIQMKAPDGVIYPMDGTFQEVVKPERLVFVSAALDTNGKRLFEVMNIILFTEEAGKTKLTLRLRAFNITPEGAPYLNGMNEGWNMSLDKLESLLQTL
jgi:uncharacterized protein YndB with AHSA1/START domain